MEVGLDPIHFGIENFLWYNVVDFWINFPISPSLPSFDIGIERYGHFNPTISMLDNKQPYEKNSAQKENLQERK